ncbi:V-set and immunoglobulin domain-containing protein 10 [Solea senegalensis]|uniref:V-set and immunoglobulin domain-containing protein 10 n=1 Tax=Solea senegalensis TaxID=28829 RepID=UPI001C415C99|nr:V-set and immunoglobulin domain-containing protein 10 [Solea senegalensis]KAG7490522.1 V-set and immunoglobulin domain-containing protein 10 [Solea senegalensis]
MKTVTTAALLYLCLCATVAVSDDSDTETALTAAPGDVALLPCYTAGNVTPSLTTWLKDGQEVVRGGDSSSAANPAAQRLTVLRDGSLNIMKVIRGDEGTYLCSSTLPGNNTFHARVLLQVASSPEIASMSIGPATALSNGTLIVYQGSTVFFNCSGSSYPSQRLIWGFYGASFANMSLIGTLGSWLDYRIEDIQPSAQGEYRCSAHNTVSHQTVDNSSQLLVYYAPDRHPECMWTPAQDPSHILFNCTWFGAYPTPTLLLGEDRGEQGARRNEHIYATEVTDSLSVTLNRSLLSDGQTVWCMGQHLTLAPGKEKSCSLTLKLPYPEGQPIATALEGTSITLTCSESVSMPPASTTWRRGLQQEYIVPGSKYVLSEEGPVLKLTILNISKDDEGVYFCRSENTLNVTELEVYLTVKTSSTYTGVIIGIFIAALIVGSTVIIAKTIYSNRHRICLGGGFGQVEDRGDVLDLVESDDEQIFQDAVPRLPPITNGNHTTLVQIHRIPSSDHEDAESGDTSPQKQEDTVQKEEPVELVSF